MGNIRCVVVQRIDHLVRTAGNRHDKFEVQSLAAKESFPFRDCHGQRKNAAHRRTGLRIAQRNSLRSPQAGLPQLSAERIPSVRIVEKSITNISSLAKKEVAHYVNENQ